MPGGRHHIENLELRLKLPPANYSGAESMNARIRAEIYQKVIPALQSLFDEICPDDQVLVIDELDLDLGKFSAEDVSSKISGEIIKQLQIRLREKAGELKHSPKPVETESEQKEVRTSLVQRRVAEVAAFLNEARSPRLFRMEELEAWLIRLEHANEQELPEWEALLPRLGPKGRIRLISGYFKVFFRLVLLRKRPRFFAGDIDFLTGFAQDHPPSLAQVAFGLYLWERDLPDLEDNSGSMEWIQAFFQLLLKRDIPLVLLEKLKKTGSPARTGNPIRLIMESLKEISVPMAELVSQAESLQENRTRGIARLDNSFSRGGIKESHEIDPEKPLERQEPKLETIGKDRVSRDLTALLFEEKSTGGREEKAWFVSSAGLVLLAPFLERFFQKQGLLDEQNLFLDEYAARRAACMLDYLAWAREKAPEPDLSIPKVICGLDLEMPLWLEEPFSQAEKAESEALLKAVIGHWPALKGSGPDAVREGFLQRKGKLIQSQHGWKLLVEGHTLDILLSKVPWSYSILKYPWMPQMMFVDWG